MTNVLSERNMNGTNGMGLENNAYDVLYDEPIESKVEGVQEHIKKSRLKADRKGRRDRSRNKENSVSSRRQKATLKPLRNSSRSINKYQKSSKSSLKSQSREKSKPSQQTQQNKVDDKDTIIIQLKTKKLETFPSNEEQANWSKAREIDLSFNHLKTLCFRDDIPLVNCKKLKLSGNQIESISNAFTENQIFGHILEVQLGSNSISTIQEDDLSAFKRVKILSLASNQIEQVHPLAFSSLSQLKSINLSHNELITVDPALFETNRKLKEIFLDHNSLTSSPWHCMKNCQIMDEVSLSHNDFSGVKDITNMPPKIRESIRVLRFNHCGLNQFSPSNIMPKLRELHLEDNHLKNIPPSIVDNCPALAVLNIKNNDISSLSGLKHLSICSELSILKVSGNPLCRDESYCSQIQSLIPQLMSIDNVEFSTLVEKEEKEDPLYLVKKESSQFDSQLENLQKPVFIYGHTLKGPTLSDETKSAFSSSQRQAEIDMMKQLDFSLPLEELEKRYMAMLNNHVLPQPVTDSVLSNKRSTASSASKPVEILSMNETSRMYDECMRAQESIERQFESLSTFSDTPYEKLVFSSSSSSSQANMEPTRPTSSARQSRPSTSSSSRPNSASSLSGRIGAALEFSDQIQKSDDHKSLYDATFGDLSLSSMNSDDILAKIEKQSSDLITINDLPSFSQDDSLPLDDSNVKSDLISTEVKSDKKSTTTKSSISANQSTKPSPSHSKAHQKSVQANPGGLRFRIPKRRMAETQNKITK